MGGRRRVTALGNDHARLIHSLPEAICFSLSLVLSLRRRHLVIKKKTSRNADVEGSRSGVPLSSPADTW